MGERRADRDALLLAARELAGTSVAFPFEPDTFEEFEGTKVALAPRSAGERSTKPRTLARYSASAWPPSFPSSAPKTRTLPAEGRSSAARMRRSVDFPEPLGPSTTSTSRSSTLNVSPWRAAASPSGVE
jgi:hypothetical protein